LRTELPRILTTPCDVLSPRMLRVIEDLAGDWRRLDERIEGLSSEIEALARHSKGRDFGAWLGLVPKQISTGDRTILGNISKRGNRYLRALFVQAAWVVLVKVGPKHWERYGLKSWIEAAKKRLHHNVLAVALANKLARMAWSVLVHGRIFEASKIQAA
jgi:transposase